jgi:soluble lytic murein transglycosylase-like protein
MASINDILSAPRLSMDGAFVGSSKPSQQPSQAKSYALSDILSAPRLTIDGNDFAPQRQAGASPQRQSGATPQRQAGLSAPNSYKDPAWDVSEAVASAKTGVPVSVLRSIRTAGEKSNGDQVSPKGAKGVYQFIPSTRDAFLKKYGVDAYSTDPNEQAMAAALHLKESHSRTGDWVKAMAGFNGGISGEKGTNTTAENAGYVRRTSEAAGLKISSAENDEGLQVADLEEQDDEGSLA